MSQACFDNLLCVLRREEPPRPTLFEFFLNQRLHESLGGPLDPALGDDAGSVQVIRAFAAAGYDYATMHASTFGFPGGQRRHAASVSQSEGAVIATRADFEAYAWPNPDDFPIDRLDRLAPHLPDGAKFVVPGPSGVLENVIHLVGYEQLCYLVIDDPELAGDIFDAVGSRLVRYYQLAAAHPAVGACISNDDWGHKTQTLLPPPLMRRYVFPWHARIVETIHAAGRPVILHSCGARHEIMEDVIGAGFDAVHSFEDLIQPIEAAWEQWGSRIALMGGIDVDFLCRAPLEAVGARVSALIDKTACRGWAVGSGNSIPYYVPDEAYFAMIDAARSRWR
ncbi:MAG: hypothetical protein HZB16_04310 [Armatimonadetes bacterium]|nr:hypothetical protein [Armatimonadota bacterium]